MFARVTRDMTEGSDPYEGLLNRKMGVGFWRVCDKRKLSNGLIRFTLYVTGTAFAIQKLADWTGGIWEEVI